MLRCLAKVAFPQRVVNKTQCLRRQASPLFSNSCRQLSSIADNYDPQLVRNCAIIAHVDHGKLLLFCSSFIFDQYDTLFL